MGTINLAVQNPSRPLYSVHPTHPGEVLKDEVEERKLVKAEVAKQLGISPSHLSDLFKGKRHISADLALNLENLLGISAEFWLNLQTRHDLTLVRNRRLETIK